MKKVLSILFLSALVFSCTKDSIAEEDELNQNKINQIESVDGTKIKRPGSGTGD